MEKIESNIFKKNGKLYVRVTRKRSGKSFERKLSNIENLKSARSVRDRFISEAQRWIEEQESGFRDWRSAVEQYLKEAYEEKSPSTVDNEKVMIEAYTKGWSGLSLSTLTQAFVQNSLKEVMSSISDSTRRSVVKYIRNVFRFLVRQGAISTNPLDGFKHWKKSKERASLNCLTSTEMRELLTEAYKRDHSFKDVWHFCYALGLRSGEAMGLQWKDIDIERGVLKVRRSCISSDRGRVKATKSGEERVVSINSELLERIISMKPYRTDDWVLPYLDEWRNGKAARVLKAFQREIGVPETRLHDLRAAFITHCLEQGVGLSTIKAMVGHRRTETTDRYVRNCGVLIEGKTEAIAMRGVVDRGCRTIDWDVKESPSDFLSELETL